VNVNLCAFSRSQILHQQILTECPLNLRRSQKDECQCHKRLYNVPPADLRVSSCTYPYDWRGKPVSVSSSHLSSNEKRKISIDMSDKPNPATKPLFGLIDGKPLECPVIGFNGPLGSGKTLAALTLCPEETIEIGIEDSGVTYGSLPIKHRFSMYKEVIATGKTMYPKPIDCFEWFLSILDKVAKDELKARVIVVDPITDIQNGLLDYIEAHAADFGKSPAQYAKASGLLWGDAKAFMKMTLGRISRKVECFIYTSHMGTVWQGGAPVSGKSKVKGIDTFKEIASLVVHLTRDIDPQTGKQIAAPIGSIAPPHGKSRFSRFVVDAEGSFTPVPILPPRIEPFTWQKVREYVATPPDYAKLKKHEVARPEVLTDDDKLLLEAETTRMKLEEAQIRQDLADKAAAAAARNSGGAAVPTAVAAAMGAKTTTASAKTAEKPVDKPVEKAATTAPVETPPFETGNSTSTGSSDLANESLIDFPAELVPWDREKCDRIVREQMDEAGMTMDQKKNAVKKRGVEKLADMTDAQIEELRKALWNVLTKRAMEAKGKK
jgi:hypothetical protein